ncbi:MAG: hypothetical protein ACYTF6_03810, partial [Planctomycetota bacterium]
MESPSSVAGQIEKCPECGFQNRVPTDGADEAGAPTLTVRAPGDDGEIKTKPSSVERSPSDLAKQRNQVQKHKQKRAVGDANWEWRTVLSADPLCCGRCGRRARNREPICTFCGYNPWPAELAVAAIFLGLAMLGLASVIWVGNVFLRVVGGLVALFFGGMFAYGFVLIGKAFAAIRSLPPDFKPLEKPSDAELWDQIAKHSPADRRSKAVSKLESRIDSLETPVALGVVGAFSSNASVAMTAVGRLQDEGLLAGVVMRQPDIGVCRAALARINKEAIVYEVAHNTKREELRRDALAKLETEG